jgi:hypothetical protein
MSLVTRMMPTGSQSQCALPSFQARKPGISLAGNAPDLMSFRMLRNSLILVLL